MWEINHVLVKHSVWIAKNKGVLLFVCRFPVAILKRFACCCEKHHVEINVARSNPSLLAFKSFSQNFAHLMWRSENPFEENVTIFSASPAA